MSAGHTYSRNGFTLIELLIVIAILALLVSILLPSLAAAREVAKVTAAWAEIRSATVALETYMLENREAVPPARTYCDARASRSLELPPELAAGGYLPSCVRDGELAVDLPDRFASAGTYRYVKPGWGLHNDGWVPKSVWVPDHWPADDPSADPLTLPGRSYDNVWKPQDRDGSAQQAPIAWAVFSAGPGYDSARALPPRAPLARCSWYRGWGTRGVLTAAMRTGGGILAGTSDR